MKEKTIFLILISVLFIICCGCTTTPEIDNSPESALLNDLAHEKYDCEPIGQRGIYYERHDRNWSRIINDIKSNSYNINNVSEPIVGIAKNLLEWRTVISYKLNDPSHEQKGDFSLKWDVVKYNMNISDCDNYIYVNHPHPAYKTYPCAKVSCIFYIAIKDNNIELCKFLPESIKITRVYMWRNFTPDNVTINYKDLCYSYLLVNDLLRDPYFKDKIDSYTAVPVL